MGDFISVLRRVRTCNSTRRISFVSGNFKVIHPGHIRLLRFAREMADMLVVGVLPHNDFNAGASEEDRLANVQALNMVDYACLMVGSVTEGLRALRPDFVVKGKEHENTENVETQVLEEIGGKLVFSSGLFLFSEADLIDSHYENGLQLLYPHEYIERHAIQKTDLQKLMECVCGLRVVVVGDGIVDEYINCDPLGMSQEDPTIVVTPANTQRYLGGAGIVAAHAAGLGAQVDFVTICGADATANFIQRRLEGYGVQGHIFVDPTRPTPLKQRFRCRGKTLLRVSHLRQHGVDKGLAGQMLDVLCPLLDKADLLIFSDFNYGCLPQALVNVLTEHARLRAVPVVADSQSSSQVGDVSRFAQAHLLTPTEREVRLAMHDFEAGLVVLADGLLKKAAARNVIMTLGEAGILIQQGETGETDQLPALNMAAKDVAGAGDSLLVTAGLALAAGSDIWHAACLGSQAAAIQVSRQGNVPLSTHDMAACLQAWN